MIKAGVTIGSKGGAALCEQAQTWAKELGLPFIERSASLNALLADGHFDAMLVATKKGPRVTLADGTAFFFHPSMSLLRVLRLARGGNDLLLNALDLSPGESVLDCTLGLATDACVIAHALGDGGAVKGLEASPLISLVVKEGLLACATDEEQQEWLRKAASRISVENAAYEQVLKQLPDKSYDVVYFDPLFVHPVASSANMQPLRPLAKNGGVDQESLAHARRVAKRRVVIKDHCSAALLKELAAPLFSGGKYSHIRFGVWEAKA